MSLALPHPSSFCRYGKDWQVVPFMSVPYSAPRWVGVNDFGNEVWCVCANGAVQRRVGVMPGSAIVGDSWMPVPMPAGKEMHITFLSVSGVLPIDQVVNPPLLPGVWSDTIMAQLLARDVVERNSRRFGHFETFSDVIPKIATNKRGMLRWRRDGTTWETALFVLSAARKSFGFVLSSRGISSPLPCTDCFAPSCVASCRDVIIDL